MVYDFQVLVIETLLLTPCSLLDPFSGETRQPCCEDTQAALWRGPHGEELRPPTKSQRQLASHVSGHMEAGPPGLVKASDECSPS